MRQGGNIPPLWARANGVETRLIGLSWADEFQAIITLPESGITRARDLSFRRFGLPLVATNEPPVDVQRAVALKGLVSARELEGQDIEAVEIVDLPFADRFPGLGNFATGRYQAYRFEVLALLSGQAVEIEHVDIVSAENRARSAAMVSAVAEPASAAMASAASPGASCKRKKLRRRWRSPAEPPEWRCFAAFAALGRGGASWGLVGGSGTCRCALQRNSTPH